MPGIALALRAYRGARRPRALDARRRAGGVAARRGALAHGAGRPGRAFSGLGMICPPPRPSGTGAVGGGNGSPGFGQPGIPRPAPRGPTAPAGRRGRRPPPPAGRRAGLRRRYRRFCAAWRVSSRSRRPCVFRRPMTRPGAFPLSSHPPSQPAACRGRAAVGPCARRLPALKYSDRPGPHLTRAPPVDQPGGMPRRLVLAPSSPVRCACAVRGGVRSRGDRERGRRGRRHRSQRGGRPPAGRAQGQGRRRTARRRRRHRCSAATPCSTSTARRAGRRPPSRSPGRGGRRSPGGRRRCTPVCAWSTPRPGWRASGVASILVVRYGSPTDHKMEAYLATRAHARGRRLPRRGRRPSSTGSTATTAA